MEATNENIQRHYDAFIHAESPWNFFMGLSRYVKYIFTTPRLKKIANNQFIKRSVEYKKIGKMERRAIKELRESKSKLSKIITNNKINTSFFRETAFPRLNSSGQRLTLPEEMESFEVGDIPLNGFFSDNLEHYLLEIAAEISQKGYEKELKDFLVSNDEYAKYWARINGPEASLTRSNTRGNFIFSKTRPARFEQMALVDVAREMDLWGAFELLLKFWKAFAQASSNFNLEQTIKSAVDDKKYEFNDNDAVDIAKIVFDLKIIMKDHFATEERLRFLHINDFQDRVNAVHLYLLQVITTNDARVNEGTSLGPVKAIPTSKKNGDPTSYTNKIIPEIEYDYESAIGYVNSKKFKLKDKEGLVFGELYKKIGKKLPRLEVLIMCDFYPDHQQELDPVRREQETYIINDLVKSLRKKTGLNIYQLLNNAGNLTLKAERKNAPIRPKLS